MGFIRRVAFSCVLAFLAGAVSAQQLPSLTAAGPSWTLTLPYLEYTGTTPPTAYRATLKSTDGISTFTIEPESLIAGTLSPASNAITTPYAEWIGSQLRLRLPFLPFSGAAYGASLVMDAGGKFTLDPTSVAVVLPSTLAPPTNVLVSSVNEQTVGSSSFSSSTRLRVSWTAPIGYTAAEYQVVATEGQRGASQNFSAPAGSTALELTGLKAGTPYATIVKACRTTACDEAGIAEAVYATTSEEHWQIQGTGNGYASATKMVADGSVLSYLIRFGTEAGSSLSGKSQYYYKNSGSPNASGIAIAATAGTGTNIADLTAFTATGSGLWQPCNDFTSFTGCPSGSVLSIAAVQAVPLKSQSVIRLYFEAADLRDPEKTTRIYKLDSHDGYLGRDFNEGSGTSCGGTGSTDYAAGGSCEPTVLIGADGDATAGGTGLTNARQFKIGFPILDGWRWDESPGTFMVITGSSMCGSNKNSLFYATWDGATWSVAKDSTGCPRTISPSGHGPVLVHRGGARYKLYYEDDANGHTGKPLRLIYADGATSGSASTVELADWESAEMAREIHFLWPDGSKLDAEEESGLGDHMIFMPTGANEEQYMYLNLGGFDNANWGKPSSGLGMAILLNP